MVKAWLARREGWQWGPMCKNVWGLESGIDMESGLKGFKGLVFMLLINTIVLATGLFVPRKSYTQSSMQQGKGNLWGFVYTTLSWTKRLGILTIQYKTFMKTSGVHKGS